MKKLFYCFLVLLCLNMNAQVLDDFSDGDFTHNPAWTGSSEHFEVNAAGQLHLRSTGSDTSCLSTENKMVHATEWTFWLKLSFNTSANNFARIYLTSDRNDLKKPLNGFFLQAGGSDDSICFMVQEGEEISTIYCIQGLLTNHTTNELRWRIIHDASDRWDVYVDSVGGNDFRFQGSFMYQAVSDPCWFGIYTRYTSSNATKVYFDDVYVGPVIHDTIPPVVLFTETVDLFRVRFIFSESPDPVSAGETMNYTRRSDLNHPDTVSLIPGKPEALITFREAFQPDLIDSIALSGISDPSGNRLCDTVIPVSVHQIRPFDVIINEIMADPEPATGLPPGEYVEVYNRSGFPVSLSDWAFEIGNSRKELPEIMMNPGEFLLLVKDSTAFQEYGKCNALFTSSSSLSNEGNVLSLRDFQGRVIHSAEYSPDWFNGSWKEEGGWSLELTDPFNPCACGEGWEPSLHVQGGTPGMINSVNRPNPDISPPKAVRGYLSGMAEYCIHFSEPIDTTDIGSVADWFLTPGMLHPVLIDPEDPGFKMIRFTFAEPFSEGIIYTMHSGSMISDCAGNIITDSVTIQAAYPDSPEETDLIVNEVLSDPASGGSRFIELFNRSDHILDLQDQLLLYAGSDSLVDPADARTMVPETFLVFPFGFVVICESRINMEKTYGDDYSNRFLKMESFPGMKQEQGTLLLIRKWDEKILERMVYSASMHHPVLQTTEGVSLERISSERSSLDPANWHSAAETSGYATPGYQNSQSVQDPGSGETVSIHPPVFSPDNDGRDDVLVISYNLDGEEYQATVRVFDPRGRIIKDLANNEIPEQQGEFFWDGTTNNRQKAVPGMYVVYVEFVSTAGKVYRFRRTAILGAYLD
jgi:hypothetical protein